MEDDVRDRGSEGRWWRTGNEKKDLSYPINCSVLVRLRTRGKLQYQYIQHKKQALSVVRLISH